MKAKPELNVNNKNLRLVLFSSLFTVRLFTVKLVLGCCVKLNKFRTSSPPTSCYRLGLCPSTPSRSWWSWLTSGLANKKRAVGHDASWPIEIEIFINCQLIKIKFTFKDCLNGNNCCWQKRDVGRRRRRTERHQGESGIRLHYWQLRCLTAWRWYKRPETHD